MRNILLNPNENIEMKTFMHCGSIAYEFIDIENKEIMGYSYGQYVFDSVGKYMRNKTNNEYQIVQITRGREMTEEFKQTYSYYLSKDSLVYEATAAFQDTAFTGFDVVSSNGDDVRFLSDYNIWFRYDTQIYNITEDNAVYSGSYICKGKTINITTPGQYGALIDDKNNIWELIPVSCSETSSVPGIKVSYYAINAEWKKTSDGLYTNDDDEYLGLFKDGEYAIYIYDGNEKHYYPCSYSADTLNPVTVITSAGTPVEASGLEVIANIKGNEIHGLITNLEGSYYTQNLYTGSTFDNMVFYRRGSIYVTDFNVAKIDGISGGNVIDGIVPLVSYSKSSKKVYYNGSLLLKRLNDGVVVYSFNSRTIVFDDAFDLWLDEHFKLQERADHTINVEPENIESIIINGVDYKSTIDTGEWYVNLLYDAGLTNKSTYEQIYPYDGKITVTFTKDFFKNGNFYVLYEWHVLCSI